MEDNGNLGQGKDLLSVGEDVLVANARSGMEEIVAGSVLKKKSLAGGASL